MDPWVRKPGKLKWEEPEEGSHPEEVEEKKKKKKKKSKKGKRDKELASHEGEDEKISKKMRYKNFSLVS